MLYCVRLSCRSRGLLNLVTVRLLAGLLDMAPLPLGSGPCHARKHDRPGLQQQIGQAIGLAARATGQVVGQQGAAHC